MTRDQWLLRIIRRQNSHKDADFEKFKHLLYMTDSDIYEKKHSADEMILQSANATLDK